jgi:lipoprotein signal peptidase
MKIRKITAARAVKVWLDIVFVLGIAAIALLAGWLVLSPFIMAASDKPADVAVPVAIGTRSIVPVLSLRPAEPESGAAADVTRPRLVKGRGELRLETTSWGLQFVTNLGYLIAVVVGLYVVYLLRRIVATVLAGDPFAASNAFRFRLIGLILIGAGVIGPIVEYLAARIVLSRITIENVALSPPFNLSPDPIVGGLLVLALATVFERGSQLERDQSLTI